MTMKPPFGAGKRIRANRCTRHSSAVGLPKFDFESFALETGPVFAGELTTHETAGLGTDVRVTAQGGQATALVHDGQLIHLSAFPN
jgi:hypothetical protein